MDIDRTAPAIAEGEVRIAAPPATVWDVIADVSAWPTWNGDVKSVALEGPIAPGCVFRWKTGSASLTSTLARSAESFRGLIPSVLKGYSRKILKRGIDGILRSLKAEAERRASGP